MLGLELTAQYGDNPAVFTLTRHPALIIFDRNGRETYLHAQFIALEEEVFHYVAGAL